MQLARNVPTLFNQELISSKLSRKLDQTELRMNKAVLSL